MRVVADRFRVPLERFAALHGAQNADVALAFVQNGSVAAAFVIATKLVREVAAAIGRA